jgi:protein TonB
VSKPEPPDCPQKPSKPEVVAQVQISYPAAARAKGVEGEVVLRAHVDVSGGVSKVDVVRSVSPEVDVAAVAALKGWRFRPALACGKPTSGTYTMTYRFELGT